jgi:hypothetical protein
MASKFGVVAKRYGIYDSVCAMMKQTTATSMGVTTICGPITAWSPLCAPEKIGDCYTTMGAPVAEPTVLVTVSWADCSPTGPAGAGCVVSWLGVDFHNGQTREVCPTSYIKDQYTGTTLGYTAWKAAEKWQYNNSLVMHRGYMAFKNTFTPLVYRANFSDFDHQNINFLKINTDTDNVGAQNIFGQTARPVPVTYYFPPTSDIGKVAPETVLVIAPNDGAATLTADFFGTHTDGNGVTYAWQKGDGW